MDHTLEDSLNLGSTMEDMDFESSGVDNRTDIVLDTGSHDGDMAMEFEHIEEQPILMDSGNEEIIVSDFMGDQFNLQEYSIQDDQTSTMTTVEDSNQQNSQSETSIDLQYESQNVIQIKQEPKSQQPFLAVRAAPSVRPSTSKKSDAMLSTAPRQIAIAPKLPKLVPVVGNRVMTTKPVTVIANKPNFIKKVPFSSIVQAGGKGNTVLAQIGKQLVMMPPGGGSQKIKLVSTNSAGVSTVQYIKAADQAAQLIPNKNPSGPVLAKVIQVQGQPNVDASNQPAVITKIVPTSSSQNMQQTRYIMQTKTVPISIGNKVIMASPTKHGVKYTKKHEIISLKQPLPKLMPAPPSSIGPATKKVVITANPSQNVILKTTAPPKTAQVTKDGKVIVQGQRSQLHQINVPGKGIQYIRLITNQTPAAKTLTKIGTSVGNTTKTFVLSDTKGPQKLMRIAPAPVKAAPVTQQVPIRPTQSLLAPLSPADLEESSEFNVMEHSSMEQLGARAMNEEIIDQEEDSRDGGAAESPPSVGAESSAEDAPSPARPALDPAHPLLDQPTQGFEGNENTESTQVAGQEQPEHPLIVISGNYLSQDNPGDRDTQLEESSGMINEDADGVNPYQSPGTPPPDSEAFSGELAFKPRRACNCTKSQCLKLYCDCFANGEFCNSCNCNNCHNNLSHEDLRQRAIRACLERNPNAFRPKIGKTKAGGPEIIRRHNKGCNCKRSGCLKNYCECYEAKIACTAMCKCVGCRNVEDALARRRPPSMYRPPHTPHNKQPCTFMTSEVIEAVCQCLLAAAAAGEPAAPDSAAAADDHDPVRDVVDEFARCLQDIIGASHHHLLDQGRA